MKPFLAREAVDGVPSGKALRRAERETVLAESVVVHRADDLVVAVPLTERASRWWGRGTRWCTAAENGCAFGCYNETGPLVVMVIPGRAPGEPARKWQMHVGRNGVQFMDDDDAGVTPDLVDAEWDGVGGVVA